MFQAVYLSRHGRKPHGSDLDATIHVRSLIKQKSKHWKHYVKSKDPKVMASYKKICNSVRNKTRQVD